MKKLLRWFVYVLGMLLMAGMTQAENDASELQARYTQLIENKTRVSDSVLLHGLFDACWEQQMIDSPEWATLVGHEGLNDRWSDESFEGIERRKKTQQRQLEVLRSVDRAALSEVDQLNYDLFGRNLGEGIEGDRFPGELQPINQMGGVQQDVAEVINVVSRIQALKVWFFQKV